MENIVWWQNERERAKNAIHVRLDNQFRLIRNARWYARMMIPPTPSPPLLLFVIEVEDTLTRQNKHSDELTLTLFYLISFANLPWAGKVTLHYFVPLKTNFVDSMHSIRIFIYKHCCVLLLLFCDANHDDNCRNVSEYLWIAVDVYKCPMKLCKSL